MLQIYKLYFNLSIILLYFLAFLTPITKKNSLAADFPHLLEAISIILTSVVIFLSCLPLCYSGPPFSLSNARRFCRRDNHRSLWFSSGLFSRMLRHCRCPLSCARWFPSSSTCPVCCDIIATTIHTDSSFYTVPSFPEVF